MMIGFCLLYAGPITEKQTATSYKMVWIETSKNGGTVNGSWGGPMKDSRRDGLWKADVKFNLFGDGPNYRTGSITMTRSYKKGIPDGPYKYNYNVNYREGYYNSRAGKWVYTEPEGDTESVSGSFVNGRPDGHWTIKSTMRGGFESELNFNQGKPVGEIESNEYFWGMRKDGFDNDGFLIMHEEIGNHGINGWKYTNPEEVPLDIKTVIPASRFFTSDGVDDNYYAKGCEMFKWIQIYPYMASEDTPIMEGTYVYHKYPDEREDIELKEFYGGDPDWIQLNNKKKNAIKINLLQDRDREIGSKLESTLEKMRQDFDEIEFKDYVKRSGSKIYEVKFMKKVIDENPEILEVYNDPSYLSLTNPQIKPFIEMVSDENIEKERQKRNVFLEQGKNSAKRLIGNRADSIPNAIIDSLYSNENNEVNYNFLLDRNSKKINIKGEKNLVYGSGYKKLDDWGSWLLDYYKDNCQLLQNTEEISEDDLLIFFALYELIEEHDGFHMTTKYKQAKNKVKKATDLLNGINYIRKNIPNTFNLKNIQVSLVYPFSFSNEIDLSMLKLNMEKSNEWQKILKYYNKILKRK